MKHLEIFSAIQKCVNDDYPFKIEWDLNNTYPIFQDVYENLIDQHKQIKNPYYSDGNDQGKVHLDFLDHYLILGYRLAHKFWELGYSKLSDALYYSTRVRCAVDLFYTADIGDFFMPVHALGTIIDSHARYGILFKIYNSCHIGPWSVVGITPDKWDHPKFGDYVTMLGGSKVYGKTIIGNNVIISANTVIINENIPDNCIVSGASPNLYFTRLKSLNSDLIKNPHGF